MSELNNPNGRRSLSSAEQNYLWMSSGGICSFEGCSKRLVSSTNGLLTNTGIKAHIIGHKKGAARHEYMEEYGYTYDTLEDVSNLMLMCYKHSKLIDDKHTREQFPPDMLFKMKEDHEKWVDSWSELKKKNSIALIHKKLGPPITDIEYEGEAPYILLEAVEEQNEFLDFTSEGWKKGKQENEQLAMKFSERLRAREVDAAEIFPLSPVPLLIHMGFLLTDTLTLSIYQFDREKQVWVNNQPVEKEKTAIHLVEESRIEGEKELAVLVSVSGIVKLNDAEEALRRNFDYLSLTIDNPSVKRILYREEVKSIQSRLKGLVEHLIQQQDYEKIHLFYAGPAGLAIEIGRGINPRMWGEVCLYQYDRRTQPRYSRALSLT
ncbi:hypothetical protein JMA_35740 [Jeotgalibacillus malaysiensis]|uniref:SMODS-associated and fused to various effectors domain-containing protein n=1 Tax=Jeotgalibacillus malaysiensis TaxID=1508404 RepID=A0A0B5AS46_9BACL|nr:SAVED domain-containing protein [Jeotgalibacillus malaysiensis]AJD92891.1 hypothetical protein JMA_35740 [Jeotgalibacillus malaysiensis]